MSVKRTPTKSNTKLDSPMHYGSDSMLYYNPNDQQPADLNITKRSKRRLDESPNDTDITLSDLLTKMDELKTQQDAKFASLEVHIKELTSQNTDIKDSMALLSAKYDDVLNNLKIIKQENLHYKNQIKNLEAKVEQFEVNARSTTVEFRNIPVGKPEYKDNLVEIAKKIGEVVNVPITESDIRDVFRLKIKNKENGPVILDFTSTLKREKFIRATRTYNKENRERRLTTASINITGPVEPIYVAESLTTSIRRLHYLTRMFAKKHNFIHCWTSFGKVFLKRNDNEPRLRITCAEDLERLEKNI